MPSVQPSFTATLAETETHLVHTGHWGQLDLWRHRRAQGDKVDTSSYLVPLSQHSMCQLDKAAAEGTWCQPCRSGRGDRGPQRGAPPREKGLLKLQR